jgi:hypothetical protein
LRQCREGRCVAGEDHLKIESGELDCIGSDAFKQIVPRTAPPITIRGGSEYRTALSDQIQNVLTKQKTPEQAAKALADAWDATTNRLGVAKQVQALKTLNASFPTLTDTPS